MTFRRHAWAALLLGAALVACAKAPVRVPVEGTPPEGLVRGALQADNTLDVDVTGAEVRAGDQKAVLGPGGTFAFPTLPPGKHNLVAEKRFSSGAVRRLLGVATIHVSDYPIALKIRMRDATDVDAFCIDCHPKGKATRRDQIVRDVHPSGIYPKKANKSTGKYDETGRVTCESCHSIHQPTGVPHYVLVPYQNGRLCVQCH